MEVKQQDIDLIQGVLKGDQKAFTQLYQKYVRLYFLTCLRYVKNRTDAEDLLQEAFIKIYKDLHQFDPSKGTFINWSKRLVINVCLQSLRKNNVLDGFENIFDIGDTVKVDSDAIDNLSLRELTNLILKLPKGYRTVFNLFVIDGYSHKEIASKMGISESTSKTQLLKAKKLLQKKISPRELKFSLNYAY